MNSSELIWKKQTNPKNPSIELKFSSCKHLILSVSKLLRHWLQKITMQKASVKKNWLFELTLVITFMQACSCVLNVYWRQAAGTDKLCDLGDCFEARKTVSPIAYRISDHSASSQAHVWLGVHTLKWAQFCERCRFNLYCACIGKGF